ncbi:MAG: hypothetical protein COV48_05305 [Elusimicrobia bacterium CG11_big_fil_rev_8_21_14_0_20_64_6]|nr:MAG: hypothetical protein COV48_05305 [Elusimicrobia bacterium CG11_big_fil_rev_8_21_14_0_20_64_6]
MTHRAYALSLVASILAIGGAFAVGSAELEPLSGDLARIGRYDEADFGWHGKQAHFTEPLFQVNPSRIDHDIVILGDSFSNDEAVSWPNYVAAKTGARIATFHIRGKSWRALLAEPSYRASPPKIFILEVVERDLKAMIGAIPPACGGRSSAPNIRLIPHPLTGSPKHVGRPTRRTLAQIDPRHFAQFQWASLLRYLGRSSGEVVEVALTRQAFSSRRDDATLVYTGDVLKRFWTESDLQTIDCGLRQIQDAVQRDGRTVFLALLIPDKLTAYSSDLADRSLAGLGVLDHLNARGVSLIPVARALEAAIRAGIRDVYLPDDSHLGSAGQDAVSGALLDELSRRGILPTSLTRRPRTK